jgi:SIR2-like domain
MIDATTSLAFSMHSTKGVYALLLGSGISRASGIPTGWEVVLDLIRKSAELQRLDCGDDPAAWYELQTGKQPDYAELLESVAKTSAECGQVLRAYFEPDEEARALGRKAPTAAHRSIAELVAGGYVRVIITTNFDRLLEQAIEAAGIVPIVIASSDAVQGAMPVAHSRCTVIKVHGDYLDTRLRNTTTEIGRYDEPINTLLDQVFDQYGLIVCGWSAEWDAGLRGAIERCANRRFTTYWSSYGPLTKEAKQLCDLRSAQIIDGQDADRFFGELTRKVVALTEIDAPHPLSKQMAVATVKRYLAESRDRIRLRDLLCDEVRRVHVKLSEENFSCRAPIRTHGDLKNRMQAYELTIDTLLSMLVAGVCHGAKAHRPVWIQTLERIARHADDLVGDQRWAQFGQYPVFLLVYGCGVAAVASGRYATLASILLRGRSTIGGREKNLWFNAASPDAFPLYDASASELYKNSRPPVFAVSRHIQELLRPVLADYVSSERQYLKAFVHFEYIAALVFGHFYDEEHPGPGAPWVPLGRFCEQYKTLFSELGADIEQHGERWPLLRAGAFNGSLEHLREIKKKVDRWASGVAGHHGFW